MNDSPNTVGAPHRPPTPPAPGRARRTPAARPATTALFAIGGFVTASWAVRIPDISERVGASHAALGVALLCVSIGALATMRATGALCERLGPGLVSAVAAVLLSLTVVAPGLVHSVTALGVVLVAFGAATGTLNVAMNSVGVRLEAAAGRPLLPSLHAAFSFGGLGGSIVGGLAASVAGPAQHLLAVAGAGLLCLSVLARPLLSTDDDRPARPEPRQPRVVAGLGDARAHVVALGAIAGCTAYGEGALSDWAALHLRADLDAAPVLAAAGYASFSLAMACGRLGGPALLDALGETRLLVHGSLLAAVGMLVAALSPVLPMSLLGLVLVGLGLANVFPVAIARAGALAGARGVGTASTVGYGGLLVGPALIGFLAAHVGLPTALTTVSALAAVAAVLALGVAGDAHGPRLAVLPWSQAEVRARLGTTMAQAGTALQAASQRHASALTGLAPDLGAGHGDTPHGDLSLLDLEGLLGATGPRERR